MLSDHRMKRQLKNEIVYEIDPLKHAKMFPYLNLLLKPSLLWLHFKTCTRKA